MMRSVWAPKPQRSGLTPVKRRIQRESGGTFVGVDVLVKDRLHEGL